MRALLDVNVLIALFDQDHIFHERAHVWLENQRSQGIATCPLTENGVVRILSNQKYSPSLRLSPSDVIDTLNRFCEAQDHAFWQDDVSIRDSGIFYPGQMLGSRQISDVYLLGLAKNHAGRLVTFDEGIARSAVSGATPSHLEVI